MGREIVSMQEIQGLNNKLNDVGDSQKRDLTKDRDRQWQNQSLAINKSNFDYHWDGGSNLNLIVLLE